MENLPKILGTIDWSKNVDAAFNDQDKLAKIEHAILRIAVWSKQLENADYSNPALCFCREMQVSAQQSAALLGLGLYKASAASSRTFIETCLYYTYFRTHPQELATLVRVEKYFISKSDVLDYHRLHAPNFMEFQQQFGLLGNFDQWYSKISAVIHGQIPGEWNEHSSLHEIGFSEKTFDLALAAFLYAETLMHQILLCTSGNQLWSSFAPDAKSFLIKGLSGQIRTALGLDAK